MAGTLSAFMLKYAGQPGERSELPVNVKTLKDRRETAAFVHNIIAALLDAEEKYIGNVPDNLRSSTRYEMAEERVSKLQAVLDEMDEVYDE